jgi:hypothetical protein
MCFEILNIDFQKWLDIILDYSIIKEIESNRQHETRVRLFIDFMQNYTPIFKGRQIWHQ